MSKSNLDLYPTIFLAWLFTKLKEVKDMMD
jgi:hypothetical protein